MQTNITESRSRSLFRLVSEYKKEATHCRCCGEELKRAVAVHNGRIVNRREMISEGEYIDDDVWMEEKHQWRFYCRLCAIIETGRTRGIIDVKGFYRWLLESDCSRGTADEYSVRMRRIEDQFPEAASTAFKQGLVVEVFKPLVEKNKWGNYRQALLKYDEYLKDIMCKK